MKHIPRKSRIISIIIAAVFLCQMSLADELRPLAAADRENKDFLYPHYEIWLEEKLEVLRRMARRYRKDANEFAPPELARKDLVSPRMLKIIEAHVAQLRGRDLPGCVEALKALPEGASAPTPDEAMALQVARDALKGYPDCSFDAANVLFVPPDSWLAVLLGFSGRTEGQSVALRDARQSAYLSFVVSRGCNRLELVRIIIHEAMHNSLYRGMTAVDNRFAAERKRLGPAGKAVGEVSEGYISRQWEAAVLYMLNEATVEEQISQVMRAACLHPLLAHDIEQERRLLSDRFGRRCSTQEAIEAISAPAAYEAERWLKGRICSREPVAHAIKDLLAAADFGPFRDALTEEKCKLLEDFEYRSGVLRQLYRTDNPPYYELGLMIFNDLIACDNMDEMRRMIAAALFVLGSMDTSSLYHGQFSTDAISEQKPRLGALDSQLSRRFDAERGVFSSVVPFATTRNELYKVEPAYRRFQQITREGVSEDDIAVDIELVDSVKAKARELAANLADRILEETRQKILEGPFYKGAVSQLEASIIRPLAKDEREADIELVQRASNLVRLFAIFRHDAQHEIRTITLTLGIGDEEIKGPLKALDAILFESYEKGIPRGDIEIVNRNQAQEVINGCDWLVGELLAWSAQNSDQAIIEGMKIDTFEVINEQSREVARTALPHAVEYIKRSIERLEQSHRKTLQPVMEPVDINTIINEQRYHVPPYIAVQLFLEEATPPALVLGDPLSLESLLLNLLSNACDADATRITLFSQLSTDGSHITLQVMDDGSGIPPEVKSRIFEPYFTTKGSQGTGLGLAIIAKIVREHNGTIDVESQTGARNHGTTFIITLPVINKAAGPAQPVDEIDDDILDVQAIQSAVLRPLSFRDREAETVPVILEEEPFVLTPGLPIPIQYTKPFFIEFAPLGNELEAIPRFLVISYDDLPDCFSFKKAIDPEVGFMIVQVNLFEEPPGGFSATSLPPGKGLRDGEKVIIGRARTYDRFNMSGYLENFVSREHAEITRDGNIITVTHLPTAGNSPTAAAILPFKTMASDTAMQEIVAIDAIRLASLIVDEPFAIPPGTFGKQGVKEASEVMDRKGEIIRFNNPPEDTQQLIKAGIQNGEIYTFTVAVRKSWGSKGPVFTYTLRSLKQDARGRMVPYTAVQALLLALDEASKIGGARPSRLDAASKRAAAQLGASILRPLAAEEKDPSILKKKEAVARAIEIIKRRLGDIHSRLDIITAGFQPNIQYPIADRIWPQYMEMLLEVCASNRGVPEFARLEAVIRGKGLTPIDFYETIGKVFLDCGSFISFGKKPIRYKGKLLKDYPEILVYELEEPVRSRTIDVMGDPVDSVIVLLGEPVISSEFDTSIAFTFVGDIEGKVPLAVKRRTVEQRLRNYYDERIAIEKTGQLGKMRTRDNLSNEALKLLLLRQWPNIEPTFEEFLARYGRSYEEYIILHEAAHIHYGYIRDETMPDLATIALTPYHWITLFDMVHRGCRLPPGVMNLHVSSGKFMLEQVLPSLNPTGSIVNVGMTTMGEPRVPATILDDLAAITEARLKQACQANYVQRKPRLMAQAQKVKQAFADAMSKRAAAQLEASI